MSKGMRTEDEVRDSAKLVLGFDKTEDGVQQGTGQITTFNQLGFRGCNEGDGVVDQLCERPRIISAIS